MYQEENFKYCQGLRNNGALPRPIYPNIAVASNVQVSWFMRFAMEIFILIV
jgi:hypothetical protein